jgi:DNA-binding winged helix-turn-helix (wHTH) protein
MANKDTAEANRRPSRVRFEPFELDLATGELWKNGDKVRLQDKPARLLALLVEKSGELVTRGEIEKVLWADGQFVEFEHAINTAVKKIRDVLEDDQKVPRFIETLPKKGYRFIAPLEHVEQRLAETVTVAETGKPDNWTLPPELSHWLLLLAQVPYVLSYLVVFYQWYDLEGSLHQTFETLPVAITVPTLRVMALLGFTIRVFVIGLLVWRHPEAAQRIRRIFPVVFVLDVLWAATPLLVETTMTPLVSWAGLILMGWLVFGQRTLLLSIDKAS